MFNYKDKTYRLHYTEGRLELIEKRLGKSAISEFMASNGALPLASVKSHFAYALVCDDNPDVFVSPKEGMEICSGYMKEHGYITACGEIADQLQADMGFLFLTR